MRGKLDSRYAPYVQASEKEELLAGLAAAEDWLYTEEGEDATKSQYVEKLDNLKVLGDQIVFRWKESEDRPRAAAALRELANDFLSKAQGGDAAYEHIGQEDLQKVVSTFSPSRTCVFGAACGIVPIRPWPSWADLVA